MFELISVLSLLTACLFLALWWWYSLVKYKEGGLQEEKYEFRMGWTWALIVILIAFIIIILKG